MKRRIPLLLPIGLLVLLALSPLPAQGSPAGGGSGLVGLPIVSQLRVGVLGSEAKLSWLDIPSGSTSYIVYRSKLPFNSSSFAKAEKIAVVPSGGQSYVDSPPPGTAYYYAVFASGSGGKPILRFKAGENTTMFGATVAARPAEPAAPAQAPMAAALPAEKPQPPPSAADPGAANPSGPTEAAPPASAPPLLADKAAEAGSPEPVAPESGTALTPATPEAASVEEKPVETAAVASQGLPLPEAGEKKAAAASAAAPVIEAEPVATTPAPPASKPIEDAAEESIAVRGDGAPSGPSEPDRSTPLPSFLYGAGSAAAGGLPGGGARTTSEGGLSSETKKAISALDLAQSGQVVDFPSLRILAVPAAGGGSSPASASLAAAVEDIRAGNWDKAEARLDEALKNGPGAAEKAQAHYYRGACLARSGRLRDALFEFLEARSLYPAETKPWLDFLIESLGRS